MNPTAYHGPLLYQSPTQKSQLTASLLPTHTYDDLQKNGALKFTKNLLTICDVAHAFHKEVAQILLTRTIFTNTPPTRTPINQAFVNKQQELELEGRWTHNSTTDLMSLLSWFCDEFKSQRTTNQVFSEIQELPIIDDLQAFPALYDKVLALIMSIEGIGRPRVYQLTAEQLFALIQDRAPHMLAQLNEGIRPSL